MKKNIFFAHIPKVGGVSITKSFTKNLGRQRRFFSAHISTSAFFDAYKDWFKFSAIRHPCDRLVSLYFHLQKKHWFKFSAIRHPCDRLVSLYFHLQKKHMPHIARIYDFYLAKYGTCENFLLHFDEFYQEKIEKYAENFDLYCQKMGPKVSHTYFVGFIPQYKFVTDPEGNQLVDFILRHENLEQDFQSLCEKLGLPSTRLLHLNTTKHKEFSEYYTDSSWEKVKKVYEKDFELFKYK